MVCVYVVMCVWLCVCMYVCGCVCVCVCVCVQVGRNKQGLVCFIEDNGVQVRRVGGWGGYTGLIENCVCDAPDPCRLLLLLLPHLHLLLLLLLLLLVVRIRASVLHAVA